MKIFTIGHSTRTINQFIKILLLNKIRILVDVRGYPGSRTVPQFNKDSLKKSLAKYKIEYIHIPELGGRRKLVSHLDTSIESPGFKSYAQYMRRNEFKIGLANLKRIARKRKTAIMCAEAVWWSCHRRMISDRLTFDNWQVYHLGVGSEPKLHEIWNIARWDSDNGIVYDG